MKKNILLLIPCLIVIFFNSCTKSDTQSPPPVVLSTDEFIKYSVNGTNYSFIKPTDTLFSANQLNNPQPPPTTLMFANRIPASASDYVNIQFERSGVTLGSTPLLSFFAVQQIGFYPFTVSSASPIRITITEYGNIEEYISGNFSGVIVGPPPGNNQYNVTCTFRVKRKV